LTIIHTFLVGASTAHSLAEARSYLLQTRALLLPQTKENQHFNTAITQYSLVTSTTTHHFMSD